MRLLFPLTLVALSSCANPPTSSSTVNYNAPIIISSDLIHSNMDVQVLKNRSLSALSGPGGCFAGQFGSEPWELNAAEATVQIHATGNMNGSSLTSPSGESDRLNLSQTWTGVGTVIRSSATAENPRNKILSVNHTVQEAIGNGKALITTSSGAPIGLAYIVAQGKPRNMLTTKGTTIKGGDEVVLGISEFMPGGERIYNNILGLEIAPQQADKILVGIVDTPGGTTPGVSGGPFVLDSGPMAGKIQGMDVAGSDVVADRVSGAPTIVRKNVVGGDPTGRLSGGRKELDLPARSETYIEPIVDADVLNALGIAGQGVNITSRESARKSGRIFGFPYGQICVMYRVQLGASSWSW